MSYRVEIRDIAAQHAAVVRLTAETASIPEKLGQAFGAALQYLTGAGRTVTGPAIAYFEQVGEDHLDVRAGFRVDTPVEGDGQVIPFDLPAGRIATTTHLGSYDQLPEAYAAIIEGAAAQGEEIDPKSPMWEEYYSGPETPPEETRTVVCWPVKTRSERA
jgi:effector-binding domain-containing protein